MIKLSENFNAETVLICFFLICKANDCSLIKMFGISSRFSPFLLANFRHWEGDCWQIHRSITKYIITYKTLLGVANLIYSTEVESSNNIFRVYLCQVIMFTPCFSSYE